MNQSTLQTAKPYVGFAIAKLGWLWPNFAMLRRVARLVRIAELSYVRLRREEQSEQRQGPMYISSYDPNQLLQLFNNSWGFTEKNRKENNT